MKSNKDLIFVVAFENAYGEYEIMQRNVNYWVLKGIFRANDGYVVITLHFKKSVLIRVEHFSKLHNITFLILSGCVVDRTSEVCVSAMLL